MKISVDIAALCSKNHFGNYVVTKNLIEAINLYDSLNEYYLYSFCKKPLYRPINKNIHYLKLSPKFFWMSLRVSLEEIRRKNNIFLALNQAIPFLTGAKVISFCHGLSYYFYPQYYPDSYQKLKSQLETMVRKSVFIVVSSKKVKEELISIYPHIEEKIKVLPFGIPSDMGDKKSKLSARSTNKYFLFVGMDHPVKNINFIRKAFEQFRKNRDVKDYKLYLITKNISRQKLRELYQGSTALLTASFYESFNLPVLEALSFGSPVIGLKSAIIPELKPYVNLASSIDDFVDLMKSAARNKLKRIDQQKLRFKFNWKSYIDNLKKLYF